jgi:hypothetical protein
MQSVDEKGFAAFFDRIKKPVAFDVTEVSPESAEIDPLRWGQNVLHDVIEGASGRLGLLGDETDVGFAGEQLGLAEIGDEAGHGLFFVDQSPDLFHGVIEQNGGGGEPPVFGPVLPEERFSGNQAGLFLRGEFEERLGGKDGERHQPGRGGATKGSHDLQVETEV